MGIKKSGVKKKWEKKLVKTSGGRKKEKKTVGVKKSGGKKKGVK